MHLTTSPVDWYAARAAGVAAYLILTLVVCLGHDDGGQAAVRAAGRASRWRTSTASAACWSAASSSSTWSRSRWTPTCPSRSRRSSCPSSPATGRSTRRSGSSRRSCCSRLRSRTATATACPTPSGGARTTSTSRSGSARPSTASAAAPTAARRGCSRCSRPPWRRFSAQAPGAPAAARLSAGLAVAGVAAVVLGRARPAALLAAAVERELVRRLDRRPGRAERRLDPGLVSAAATADGKQRALIRADLLLEPSKLDATSFQLEFLPSGLLCTGQRDQGAVVRLRRALPASDGTRRVVHASWRLTEGSAFAGTLHVTS